MADRVLLLHHGRGIGVWHDRAAGVAKDLVPGNGQLDEVAHLSEREVAQKGQVALDQHLRASVAAAGQLHVVLRTPAEVVGRPRPAIFREGVVVTENVGKVLLAADKHRRPISGLLGLDEQARTTQADLVQALDVDVRQLTAHDLLRRGLLREALAQDAPKRLELIDIQALDCCQHLPHLRLQPRRRTSRGPRLADGSAFGAVTSVVVAAGSTPPGGHHCR
mmetsp:Transcript_128024/g.410215  ORF Transcript_128024/g.410215 Transcript_128024/m.410215 type:complete len:221 (+) Transcript_128024:2089-2751(+)